MTTQTRPDNLRRESRSPLAVRLGAFGTHLSAWVEAYAASYEAAALYEQLSRMSNTDLRRLGLSRATLGWDIARGAARRQ